jgi:hypothetical protein
MPLADASVRPLPGCLLVLVLLTGATAVSAQPFETLGTRALGMGGAFVAVADDATAPYWNPAGIATGALVALGLEHGRLDRGDEEDGRLFDPASNGSATFLGLTLPSLGVSYYRVALQAVDPFVLQAVPPVPGGGLPYGLTSLVTHQVALTLAQTLVPGLHVATAVKFVRGSAGQDVAIRTTGDPLALASEIGRRSSSTVDLDVGVMAAVGRVRVGLTGRNLREPEFETPGGGAVAVERLWRAGAAVFPGDRLIVAVDADLMRTQLVEGDERRNVAAGVEAWLLERRLAVRTGVRASTVGDARPVGAGGASYALTSAFFVDGQVSRGARAGDSSWTVSARFAF